jgi:hypothetical protein
VLSICAWEDHKAQTHDEEVEWGHILYEGLIVVAETDWAQEEAEETLAPVILEESEILADALHLELIKGQDEAQEKEVKV